MRLARHIVEPLIYLIFALALITYIPAITLWLPSLF
jgi:TRAP-type C4-dicarboxylate transport system permease large subunit